MFEKSSNADFFFQTRLHFRDQHLKKWFETKFRRIRSKLKILVTIRKENTNQWTISFSLFFCELKSSRENDNLKIHNKCKIKSNFIQILLRISITHRSLKISQNYSLLIIVYRSFRCFVFFSFEYVWTHSILVCFIRINNIFEGFCDLRHWKIFLKNDILICSLKVRLIY